MNRSVADTTRELLVVSQFTLYGDTERGRRPSWIAAARPEHAEPLSTRWSPGCASWARPFPAGRFRVEMAVELVNDGPVTLVLELDPR